jgi:hypothetical protein
MHKTIFSLFVVILILSSGVSALKIYPAKIDMAYVPGETFDFSINIINDLSKDIDIAVSFVGYSDNIEILNSENGVVRIPSSSTEKVDIRVLMPELENFGKVRFSLIKFYQVPDKIGQVGATVAIMIPLDTVVPYPDKFVRIIVEEPGVVKKGEEAELKAELNNPGLEILRDLNGYFTVVGKGKQVTVPVRDIPLLIQKKSEAVDATIFTNDLSAGPYNVTLTMNYEGGSKTSKEKLLIVGSKEIIIQDIKPKNFTNSSINNLEMVFLNLWIDALSPTITAELLSGESVIRTVPVGVYTLPIGQYKSIITNLDLTGVSQGAYVIRVKSDLEGTLVQKDFNIIVNPTPKEVKQREKLNLDPKIFLMTGLVICVLLLIIAVLILFVRVRKKRRRRGGRFFGREK